jgi:drug/metabolite transporter (DMT)-like permease
VLLLGETVPSNLVLGLLLVMAGVAAMTIPSEAYSARITRLVRNRKGNSRA